MLKRITIEGLGPHANFTADFNPRGTTVVSGPSECGKTTILEGLTFALWGKTTQGKFPVAFIRDGCSKAVVELVLDSGKTVRRTINRNKSQSRRISHWGNEESYTSDTKFLDALGDLGGDPVACQLVVAPLGWVPLVAANARPFRDVLSRILPAGDVHGEIRRMLDEQGFELLEEEELQNEKLVGTRRRDARKLRDESAGRVKALKERIARILDADDEPAIDTSGAEEVLARHQTWDDFSRQATGAQARVLAIQNQKAWDARRSELGDAPAYEDGDAEDAANTENKARDALKKAMDVYTEIDSRKKLQQEKLKDMTLAGPDVCPTCEREGWEGGQAAFSEQEQAVAALETELDAALNTGKSCRQAHKEAKAALHSANADRAAAAAFAAELRGLGPRPELPEIGSDSSEGQPDCDAPTDDELAEARAVMDRVKAQVGAAQQRKKDLDEARAELDAAEGRYGEQCGEVDRLGALLDAVRAAPSAVAQRQAEALGDLGPVSLEFGENPAVSVLVDGRPWWLASRGRQVVADVWLRSAIRRALGLAYLPIVIDNVQDVGGQPVPHLDDGPTIVLKTTDGPSIQVVRKRA